MRCKMVGLVLALVATAGALTTAASAVTPEHGQSVAAVRQDVQNDGGGEGPNR
ncbi:hypothetical protein [Lentzea sp.]|uniref:hypothetical protein n=1 Tax=Lentzea sp. TaxID=56099 RepID=UPI002ED30A4D